MNFEVQGKVIETDEQGFLNDLDDWSEEFVEKMAELDGVQLYDESWGMILYFRDYFAETSTAPSMRMIVRRLGKQQHGNSHRKAKEYEKFLYKLFPSDPVREICKLAGLPKPRPDS